jgi:mono/diheme cytochrome c family protein
MSISRRRRRTQGWLRNSRPQLIQAVALLLPGFLVLVGLGLWLLCRPTHSQAAAQPATLSERDSSRRSAAMAAEPGPEDALYRRRCMRCHESDGTGSQERGAMPALPDFSNHRWQATRSNAGLLASILEGKGTQMPAFRGKISDQEARGLVTRIRQFDPMPTSRPTAGTSGSTSADPPDDFERRFRRLDEELQELKRKFHELSPPPKEP